MALGAKNMHLRSVWANEGSDFDVDLFGFRSLGGGEPSAGPYTGIKALMLAVLDNGITSYLSPTPRIRAEAEHWITTSGQRSPFSFTVVCETLRLEPDAVRAALRRLRDRGGQPMRTIGRRRQNVRRAGRLLVRKTVS
jgi:hypothetical protein